MVKLNRYIIRLAKELSRKRVACAAIFHFLYYFDWLFFSGIFIKQIVYFLENGFSFQEIMWFIAGTVCVFSLVGMFNSWYENCVKPETDIDIYQGLYERIYAKAQNASLSCFEDTKFYDKYMMALEDADTRLITSIDNIWSILMGAVAVVVSCGMMLRVDRWILLFMIAPVIGNFVFATALNKISYQIYEDTVVYKRVADYVNRMIHLADYAKDIRLTNIFRIMERKHKASVDSTLQVIDSYKKKSILYGWAYLFLSYTSIFEGVLFYGIYRTLVTKSLTMAQFTVLSSLMVTISSILIDFTEALISNYKNTFFIANLKEFLEFEPELPEDWDGIMPEEEIRSIEFRNVSFGYKDSRMILKDVSFRINAGETCALVGFNGAGKTTLVKLLLRLYDPTEGMILVNDIDIRKYNLAAYRKLYACAFQDGRIFARSIRDNVTMQRSAPADEAVIDKALRLAGIEDAVQQLEKGIDTILTKEFADDGVVMSGGQYQKILAARAFASDRQVLVFDEPSSALDPIAEHQLYESIAKAGQNRILIFISHRLSSTQSAQKIYLLDQGRIVERGTHQELMQLKGSYAKMYATQAKNYQAAEEEDWLSGSIFTWHRKGEVL